MKASLARAWRLIKHFLGFLLIFWFAFTIYCIFSVPGLCDLKKENPKTTAFQERRRRDRHLDGHASEPRRRVEHASERDRVEQRQGRRLAVAHQGWRHDVPLLEP